MASRIHNRAVLLGATAVAALAGWLGTGLDPVWWVTWLLPAAGFVAAAQVCGRWAWLPGAAAMAVSGLNLWSYLSILPLPVRCLFLLIPAVVFGLCTAWFGAAVRRGRVWVALTGPAAAWVSYEFVNSSLSPHSTFGSLAYTQMNCLPVIQLGAVGGVWMITGLLFAGGAAAALLVNGAVSARQRRQIALVSGSALVFAIAFGGLRLRTAVSAPTMAVGLVASDRAENLRFGAPTASEAILRRYLAEVPALRGRGAEIIVLPEHLLALREGDPDRNAPELERLLQAAADDHGVAIVIGVDRRGPSGTEWNEARLYRPATPVLSYDKQHLLPGYENRYRPGRTSSVFSHASARVGLAICKDLDFPSLGRAYGAEAVAALIVPAFDFTADGWLHGRMAMMRGVECGFSVVRVAKLGRLTVSDSRGRVLADARSDAAEFSTVVAKCPLRPERTLYVRWGDWCGWLAVGVTALAGLSEVRARRRRQAAVG